MPLSLDALDWRILKELQANGRISNAALADKIGLSPPPTLRRMRALEQAGFIAGYYAALDPKLSGFPLTGFAMVGLASQSEADLKAFEKRLHGWPIVRESFMLTGDFDYSLKCVAPDLESFQTFILKDLTAAPNVALVKTTLAIRCAKFEPGVPIDLARKPR